MNAAQKTRSDTRYDRRDTRYAPAAAPDHLLPYEFARDQRPSQHTPERALLLAVLADAVDIVTGSGKRTEHSTRQSLLRADTVRWFFSDESDFIFAFLSICDLFDFNAGKIRAALNLQSIECPVRRRGRRQIWSEGRRRRVKTADG